MIFKPDDSLLWDTFILPHDGKFYLFYLQSRKDFWDGYGLAVSEDLLHWEDRGTVLDLGPCSGTGMVYRAGESWILSSCKMTPGEPHHVCFARSGDLHRWEKLPESFDFYPDPAWYDAAFPGQTSSRFGDLWVEPRPGGSFLGFLTASAAGGPAGANGVVGLAHSPDGLHWTTLPPASRPCGMSWAEVAGPAAFPGGHYMLVGSNSGLGRRFDPVNNPTGKSGGMYVMRSDKIEGPYELVPGDPMLLGCRNAPPNWAYVPTYYARPFQCGEEVLVCHHWLPRRNFTDAWLGTCKTLREENPGKLSLHWWPGNENLKGALAFDLAEECGWTLPKHYGSFTGRCAAGPEGLVLETGSSALVWRPTGDYSGGLVAELRFTLRGEGAAGVVFGGTDAEDPGACAGPACLCSTRGLVEFGIVKKGLCSPAFFPENQIPWPVEAGREIDMRLLVRGEFVEVYIGDKLVQCYGFSADASQNIGFFSECEKLTVHSMKAYAFAL